MTTDIQSHHQIMLESARKRAKLAEQWPDAAKVSAAIDPHRNGSEATATKLRRQWRLLAVYLDSPAPHYRFPTWQFRQDGQPVVEMHEILTVLRSKGPFTPDSQGRTTGWGEVEWFNSCHVLLDGASPAEVLVTTPQAVLRATHAEFDANSGSADD